VVIALNLHRKALSNLYTTYRSQLTNGRNKLRPYIMVVDGINAVPTEW